MFVKYFCFINSVTQLLNVLGIDRRNVYCIVHSPVIFVFWIEEYFRDINSCLFVTMAYNVLTFKTCTFVTFVYNFVSVYMCASAYVIVWFPRINFEGSVTQTYIPYSHLSYISCSREEKDYFFINILCNKSQEDEFLSFL